jgi:PAS domain S-box-containing protein
MGRMATILVVEDNPISSKLLRITLESEGYRVLVAPDGARALALVATEAPDLVVQDLHLPDMDGFDLVRLLRRARNGGEVPILALSGFLARLEEAQAAEMGFNGFLVKPIAPSLLVETINLFLPKASLATAGEGQGRRLLAVSEGSIELTCAERFLAGQGFLVNQAVSGGEALASARADPPAAILVDLLLPDMDGIAFCHEVRHDPRLARTPVLIMASHALDDELRKLARAVGADALVSRRAGLEELDKALFSALEQGPQPPEPDLALDAARIRFLHGMGRQFQRMEASHTSLSQQVTLLSSQIAILGNMCEALSRSGETDAILQEVLGSSLDAAGVSKGALFLLDGAGNLLLNQSVGYLAEDRPVLEDFFGRSELLRDCLARGVILTPTEEKAGPHLSLPEGLSALLVPVVHARQPLGVLFMVTKRSELRGSDPLGFARALAAVLAQALTLTAAFSRLSLSEERYRGIVESTTEGVWTIDLERRTTFVNQRVCELLGYSAGELVGKRVMDFLDGDQGILAQESMARTLSGHPVARELRLRRRDGSQLWVSLSTAPIMGSAGVPIGAMAIMADLSEQKKLQEQLMTSDRMASVGTLAAGVAHEINNPLTVVLANLELAQSDLDGLAMRLGGDAVRHLAEKCRYAQDAASRVAQIVRDLKIFSRSEEDLRQAVELQPILESAVRMAWNEIRHRARLVKDYQPVPRVAGNEARLGQVFLNLLVNAAQAIPEGHAELNEISVSIRPDGPGKVLVEIRDTGAGMPPEVLRRLFTPFFTTKPVGIGTGLGLSICHRIITGMEGEIRVESQVGRGSSFRILLPEAQAEPPAPEAVPAVHRGSLLVVDDEPMVAVVLQTLLAAEHEITVQTCAQDALRNIQEGARYDLILCDLMMPTMTGMDLHQELAGFAPDQAARMIFMSGGAFTPGARAFLERMPNDRVEKPFHLAGLKALIAERMAAR